MSNVQLMHFLNGEDVIGDVKEPADIMEDFGTLTVSNPCVVVLVPDPQHPERVGVRLQPWAPFAGSTSVKVSRSHIVYMAEPVKELINQYNTIFGTGIVLASAGDVPQPPTGGATLHRIK